MTKNSDMLLGEGVDWQNTRDAISLLELTRTKEFSLMDIESPELRRKLTALHPMLERRYFISTDQATGFYDIVYDHVLARKSGLYCMGEYRVGKTRAIEYAIEKLAEEMPWAAAVYLSAERNMNQSKKSFFAELLKYFGCASPSLSPLDRLPRYLITKAVKAGSRTCVLFIDEAQMLTVMHMRYLLELWNELWKDKFILITVLVGQKGLDDLKQLTDQQDHKAVVARFFVKSFGLGGLRSVKELHAYLRAYDEELFYPTASQWSYSRFFLKNAFDKGWRLSNEADLFWRVLIELTSPTKDMLRYFGYKLAFINDAIHSFYLDSMKNDTNKFMGSNKLWLEAVSSAATTDLLIGNENLRD